MPIRGRLIIVTADYVPMLIDWVSKYSIIQRISRFIHITPGNINCKLCGQCFHVDIRNLFDIPRKNHQQILKIVISVKYTKCNHFIFISRRIEGHKITMNILNAWLGGLLAGWWVDVLVGRS